MDEYMMTLESKMNKIRRIVQYARSLDHSKETKDAHIQYRDQLIQAYKIMHAVLRPMEGEIEKEIARLERHITMLRTPE